MYSCIVYNIQVIAELMPLIVSVLEELDVAFQECDDAVLALEELRDELSQTKQEMKRQRQLRELIEEVFTFNLFWCNKCFFLLFTISLPKWKQPWGLIMQYQEKASSEEMLETQKKRLSDQQEQLQSLNKSMSLNLSSKKEYSMYIVKTV